MVSPWAPFSPDEATQIRNKYWITGWCSSVPAPQICGGGSDRIEHPAPLTLAARWRHLPAISTGLWTYQTSNVAIAYQLTAAHVCIDAIRPTYQLGLSHIHGARGVALQENSFQMKKLISKM